MISHNSLDIDLVRIWLEAIIGINDGLGVGVTKDPFVNSFVNFSVTGNFDLAKV